jgi:hypothetical protein
VRRSVLILLLGIALQGIAAVAVIAWWTREEPAADTSERSIARERAAAPAPRLATAATFEDPGDAPEQPAQSAEPGSAARSGPSVVESTPAPRRRALRSFRQEMKAGLAALQKRVAECAAPKASFTLDVETFDGGVRVLDAHLNPGGSAADPAVACARAALLGETIAAPSAEPGRRWQMPFLAPSPK